jgi:hypothetical protein
MLQNVCKAYNFWNNHSVVTALICVISSLPKFVDIVFPCVRLLERAIMFPALISQRGNCLDQRRLLTVPEINTVPSILGPSYINARRFTCKLRVFI